MESCSAARVHGGFVVLLPFAPLGFQQRYPDLCIIDAIMAHRALHIPSGSSIPKPSERRARQKLLPHGRKGRQIVSTSLQSSLVCVELQRPF